MPGEMFSYETRAVSEIIPASYENISLGNCIPVVSTAVLAHYSKEGSLSQLGRGVSLTLT